jgi:lipoprotein-anchoring transpeptidase ErfK/SrfK
VATVVTGRTEFGSSRALGVVRRRGPWLGVTLPELGNGRLGWVHGRRTGVQVHRTAVRVEIDLSSRELVLQRGARVMRRMRVSVGRAGSPTPTGRYAVTDKLPGHRFSRVYGCCILALSGRQPRLPAGWTGGDRLAIHGTVPGAPIGGRASAGCLHASEADLRALMQSVPVGAPVVIRA